MDDAIPSARLLQVLLNYCTSTNPVGIADLRQALTAGRYPWLRDELRQALASGALTAETWASINGRSDPVASAELADQQQHLWRALFPNEPNQQRAA
jgi:hypothetical protein